MTSGQQRRHLQHRHKPRNIGVEPGTLTVHPHAAESRVCLLAYGPEGHEEHQNPDLAVVRNCLVRWPVTWVHVEGLANLNLIKQLGDLFHVHGLALEDVLSLHQHAKVEQFPDHLFVVVRMIDPPPSTQTEQLNLFSGRNFLLSFHEAHPGNYLEPLRKRIRDTHCQLHATGVDYLVYSVMDAVIDAYFPHLDYFSDQILTFETEIFEQPTPEIVAKLNNLRHDLLTIRRMLSPLREVINALLRDAGAHFSDVTRLYLRDCYDHTIHILDMVETYRETAASLLDLYLSSVSHRLNEIMKVLTLITVLFIPLSFLAAIYGMNFDVTASPYNMPELKWHWGYPFFLAVCCVATLVQLYLFRRKGWLGSFRRKRKKTRPADTESQPEKERI